MWSSWISTADVGDRDREMLNKKQVSQNRSIMGSVLYISTKAGPDICTAARMVASFGSKLEVDHQHKSRRALIYLRATQNKTMIMIP